MAIRRTRQRSGTAAEWTAANPVLKDGELGIETDTKRQKIGNGATAWSALTAVVDTFTSSSAGLVPPTNGATGFLGADGWFSDPAATEPGLQQKVGIVAYFYPDTAGYWEQFEAYGTKVRLAVMNPSSGPGYGTTFESGGATHTDYTAQLAETQAAGIKVVHYLSTNYRDIKSPSTTTYWKGTVGVSEQFSADAGTDTITTTTSHGFPTGFGPIQVKAWDAGTTTSVLPGGLAASTNYWVISTGASTMKLATSEANALAGTPVVDITSAGTGSGFYLGISRTLANIQNVYDEIDLVYSRYPDIDGIFFDEMVNDGNPDDLTYYQALYDYCKTKDAAATVVMNPGAGFPESYEPMFDIAMSFEGTYTSYSSWTPNAWQLNYPAERFWHAITTCANQAEAEAAVTRSRTLNAGTVSCNSGGSFSNLPSFFAATMTAIDSGNAELVAVTDQSYGTIFFDQNPSSETACVANTWIKAKGWTTPGTLEDFVHTVDGRLTYAGDTPKTFRISAGISYTKVSGTATVVKWALRKNGVEVAFMERWASVGAASTDYHNIELDAVYSLSSTDYVEVWCQTDTGDNLIVQRGQIVATEV